MPSAASGTRISKLATAQFAEDVRTFTGISEREGNPSGSVIVASLEGTRPMLIEIQALLSPTAFGMPRRTGIGID